MATIRTALLAKLEGDATLTGILTGGVWDASEVDRRGVTPREAVYEADGVRLKPLAVVRWRSAVSTEIVQISERRFFEIYFYEDYGYVKIETAKRRVKALLHRELLPVAGEGTYFTVWVDDLGERVMEEEDVFGGASMDMSRFYIIYTDRDRE
ncbi:MAG: hypothetical protein RIC84_08795 [Aggregatilineales bacterium]